MEFVVADQESKDSLRAEIRPFWAGNEFSDSEVRLIGGDAELLIAMDAVRKLSLSADF